MEDYERIVEDFYEEDSVVDYDALGLFFRTPIAWPRPAYG